jgi:hypothetical protein
MKLGIFGVAVALASLGFAAQAVGQSNSDRAAGKTFTHGESKRCETMTGAAKAQCDQEEATKAQGPAAQESQPATGEDERASNGSSAAAGRTEKTFTHGESKRCESLSGADKDVCDKEEATKAQGDAARELSEPDLSR